jgi:chromosome segregation ATPase
MKQMCLDVRNGNDDYYSNFRDYVDEFEQFIAEIERLREVVQGFVIELNTYVLDLKNLESQLEAMQQERDEWMARADRFEELRDRSINFSSNLAKNLTDQYKELKAELEEEKSRSYQAECNYKHWKTDCLKTRAELEAEKQRAEIYVKMAQLVFTDNEYLQVEKWQARAEAAEKRAAALERVIHGRCDCCEHMKPGSNPYKQIECLIGNSNNCACTRSNNWQLASRFEKEGAE